MGAIQVRTSVTIDGNRLGDNKFTSVSIEQKTASHHNFEIHLQPDAVKGILASKAQSWIGKSVNIGIGFIEDKGLRNAPLKDSFKGIITHIKLTRESGSAKLLVQGQSPTIYTDDGPNTRSFTDKGLQEIVDDVLRPYKAKFPYLPNNDPKVFTNSLPYTVQYKENNFSFIARLANRYGEWFYYDGLQLYFGKPSGEETIPLDFGVNGLTKLNISVQASPMKFKLIGYDYMKHNSPQKEEAPLSSKTSTLGKEVMNIANRTIFSEMPTLYGSTTMDKKEFKNIIKRMEQVSMDEILMMEGSSRNPNLKIGIKIEVKDKDINENYGKFVITRLDHSIGQGGNYENQFEAIPEKVETAPLLTFPDPPFCETQLAKVTDVDDEKGLGRVKVKFQWQEGSEEKSPWIRVASPYTGKDKGFYITPEVDDQVLVAFENHHPDKPYVLTGMYNSDAKPEWFNPKNQFKGFKSKGQNEWQFDDKKKSITINAPESILMSAGKEITIKTGGKEGKGKEDSKIKIDVGDGTVTIIAKTINVEAAELINLDSKKDITETAGKNVTIKGNSKVDIESTEVGVKGSAKAKVEGAQVDVKGSAVVNVKAAMVKIN